MIQILKHTTTAKIRFTREHSVVESKATDPSSNWIDFDLVSAHVCKHCDTIVQAVYKTDRHLKEVSRDFFKMKEGLRAAKFAVSRPQHSVSPAYHSFLLDGRDGRVEVIRESFHFNFMTEEHNGRCPYRFVVYDPGPFDLRRYLYGMAGVLGSENWFQFSDATWQCFDNVMNMPDKQEVLLDRIKSRFQIIEDQVPGGSPLWLLCKGEWNYYTLDTELRNILNGG